MSKKFGLWWICLALMVTMIVPSVAAADGNNSVELRFKVGSVIATINGQRTSIAKPYSEKGATMVPLSLITKAFHVDFSFENNKKITLTSTDHTIQFVIGSTKATVDGQTVDTGAAPKLVGGVVMVPLRVVTDTLGATLRVEADKTIVVTGSADQTAGDRGGSNPGGINSDAGKTMIGDSYNGWSMRYPTGLVKRYQSENDGYITFTDEKGTYLLAVYVEPQSDSLTNEDVLSKLTDSAAQDGGLVVDKKMVDSAAIPYAQITTKNEDGIFSAIRGYYANDTYFELFYSDGLAKNYKDLAKHNDLLNSFRPSFDAKNTKLKDLSTVVGGMRKAVNADYGVTLSVPAEWSIDAANLMFVGNDSSQLTFDISSATAGQTVEQWANQMDQYFKDVFLPEYWKHLGTSPIQVGGYDGVLKKYQYTVGDESFVQYEVFMIVKGFKYLIEFDDVANNPNTETLFNQLIKSVKLNNKQLVDNFGFLEDYRAYVDRTKRALKTSKKSGVSISIPDYWTLSGGDISALDSGRMQYQFPGGSFDLAVNPTEGTLEDEVASFLYVYNQQQVMYHNYKVTSHEATTLAGQPAHKFILDGKNIHYEQIIMVKNGKAYSLLSTMMNANRTDVNVKAVQDTVQSLKVTK